MKLFHIKSIIILCFTGILVGCYDEGKLVEIPIAPKAPQLVIYSHIYPVEGLNRKYPLGLSVSKTSHIYDVTSDIITDAEVFLYKNDQQAETLEYVDSLGYYPISDLPAYNDYYHIEVRKTMVWNVFYRKGQEELQDGQD